MRASAALICNCAVVLLMTSSVVGTAGGLKLTDLPSHPEEACSTAEVRMAFGVCAFAGPSEACCFGLDALFANSSSQSFGCLCFPQVLYVVATTASNLGLDALSLLSTCRQQHNTKTQWASANPTSCPSIPVTATAADLLPSMGEVAILRSARSRPPWSWGHLLQAGEAMSELPDMHAVWQQLFGAGAFKLLLLVMVSVCPLYIAVHLPLVRWSRAYVQLPVADRFIVCQHSVYACVSSLSVVPQTWLAFTALFRGWTGAYLASPQLTVLCALFLSTRALLYIAEGTFRLVHKRNWLLVVHHELFFVIIVLGVWTENAAVVGIGIVLDLFACHEAPLYITLIAYRLHWNAFLTRALLKTSCLWYTLTKIFQTVVLIYMIAGFSTMSAVRVAPEFVCTAALCAAFTLIQAYTLLVYKNMDCKLKEQTGTLSSSQAIPVDSKSRTAANLHLEDQSDIVVTA